MSVYYVLRDQDGYLAGYGEGTVLAAPAGITAFPLAVGVAIFKLMVEQLPGWAGDWRMVQLDEEGLPTAYTPRPLTEDEQRGESLRDALDRWALGALKDKTPAQIYSLVQGRIDGWASLADARTDLREWLPLLAVGLVWLAVQDQ